MELLKGCFSEGCKEIWGDVRTPATRNIQKYRMLSGSDRSVGNVLFFIAKYQLQLAESFLH